MYENVLVATDGSDRADRAADHAVELASQSDGRVHALYVMDMGDVDYVSTPSDIEETRSRLESKGREYVTDIDKQAAEAGIDCTTAIESGIPEETIAEYAKEHDNDLIVLGKRGRSDPDKPAFGSITGRVIGHADVPVHSV